MQKSQRSLKKVENPFASYQHHGVEIVSSTTNGGAIGNCPWCAKRDGSSKRGVKTLYIRADGQVWECKACGKKGNLSTFFLLTSRMNAEHVPLKLLNNLSVDRGGLETRTLKSWGVGFNGVRFTHPAWLFSGEDKPRLTVSDLRTFRLGKKAMSSPGGHAGIMMAVKKGEAFRYNSKTVWLCEGEWDGMAWWEALQSQGIEEDVFAVPGASTLPQRAFDLFQGKDVITLYDHDIPGQLGQERAWKKLEGIAKTLRRIKWPEGLADGYDIRDLYIEKRLDGAATFARVSELLTDEPFRQVDEYGNVTEIGANQAENDIDPKGKGMDSGKVIRSYRKWLKLKQPELLDVVFGAAFANRMDIDPMWLFLVGPPGCGKSELLMSLGAAPLMHEAGSITQHTLISGMNVGGKDPSLIPKLIGKTWIVKDFTTILGLPQMARDEIFGVLRDAYDGRIEKWFGNLPKPRKYEGRFGIIAGVTNKIDSVTAENAVLGERFIRYRMRNQAKVLAGTETIMCALGNLTSETAMRGELKEIAEKVLNRPITRDHYPELPLWLQERVCELAQWVASMRGVVERSRWGGNKDLILSKPSPEIGTRLAKQFCTLGLGIGVYRGVKTLDEEIYSIIASVGRDTCPDRVEEVIRAMYVLGGESSTAALAEETHFPLETVRWVLQDLDLLNVIKAKKGARGEYYLSESTSMLLKRLKIYDHDRAWKWAKEE